MCSEITTNRLGENLPPGTCRQHGPPSEIRDPGCELATPAHPFVDLGTDEDRDAWLATRRQHIGASDSPIILGLTSWSSRVRLYAEKIGELVSDKASEMMEMGRRMEPVIAAMVCEDLGFEHSYQMEGRLLASTVHPFLSCTLDASITHPETGEWIPFEVKNSSRYEDWSEGPPDRYFVQVQHQLAVTGARRGLLGVLISGWQLRWAWIERDDAFIAGTLLPELREFWRHVEDRTCPPVDASDATRQALAVLFPNSVKGEVVQLEGEWIDLGREYDTLAAQAAVLAERIDTIKNAARLALGEASRGESPDGSGWSWTGKNGRRSLRRLARED